MFTGLVQFVGRVDRVQRNGHGARLAIDPGAWGHQPAPGESVAVDGCCLTVAGFDGRNQRLMVFDAVAETLSKTTLGTLREGDPVNLEHACRPDTLLGGHLVQGHVDGVAEVVHAVRDPGNWRVRLRPPPALMDFIAPKGSVAVSGVSLTIAAIGEDWFDIALIPTTLEKTNLARLDLGSTCNIETDVIAKTVVHWLRRQRE